MLRWRGRPRAGGLGFFDAAHARCSDGKRAAFLERSIFDRFGRGHQLRVAAVAGDPGGACGRLGGPRKRPLRVRATTPPRSALARGVLPGATIGLVRRVSFEDVELGGASVSLREFALLNVDYFSKPDYSSSCCDGVLGTGFSQTICRGSYSSGKPARMERHEYSRKLGFGTLTDFIPSK